MMNTYMKKLFTVIKSKALKIMNVLRFEKK